MNKYNLEQIQQEIDGRHLSSELLQTANSQRQDPYLVAEKLAVKLWPMITEMYGYQFTSQFGESPGDTWVKCLAGITGDEIAIGLQQCLDRYHDWPPAAAQFRALCLGLDSRNVDPSGNDVSWELKKISRPMPADDPSYPHYIPKQAPKIEHLTPKEKRKATGKKSLTHLHGLLPVPETRRKPRVRREMTIGSVLETIGKITSLSRLAIYGDFIKREERCGVITFTGDDVMEIKKAVDYQVVFMRSLQAPQDACSQVGTA